MNSRYTAEMHPFWSNRRHDQVFCCPGWHNRKLYMLIAFLSVICLEHENLAQTANNSTTGVRARLYWIGAEVDPEKALAPNQSPNIDIRLHNFQVEGDEKWLTDESSNTQFILVLESKLHVEEQEALEIRLESEAPAYLLINGDEIAFSDQGNTETETYEPEQEQLSLKIIQYVNHEPRGVKLLWRFDQDEEFEPIPKELLKTQDYYFRPTNSSAKRQVDAEDRPGKFEKVAGVYPGLEIRTIRPPGVEVPVGGLATLSDGRLVVATFDARRLRAPIPQPEPDGQLWLYRNTDAENRKHILRERIAENLYEPCGVCVVGDSIYVSQRDEVTRFDYQADQQRWQPTTIATGWQSNDFHALSFGLLHEPSEAGHPGFLYMARGTGLGLKKNPPNHGSVWKIDLSKLADESVTPMTGGHRTPNGLTFGPNGDIFVTDNQGGFTPANELNHVIQGSFYGFEHTVARGGVLSPFQDQPTTEAAVILPQDEIANSPSQPLLIPDGWPFAGQMLVGDVKYGGLNRIYLEKVKGRWQGAAFRFTQGLEAGSNRMTFADDGRLFVGGIGGDHSSTWNWVNPRGEKTYQGLQSLQPNGKAVFDIQRVSVTKDGFHIVFTQPVDSEWLADISNYQLSQWRYKATPRYGGPKIDQRELAVVKAQPSGDNLAVELTVTGRKQGHVIHIMTDPKSKDAAPIWSTEAWYTLWNIP